MASVLEGNLTAQVWAQFLGFRTQLIVVMDSFIVSLDLFISGMFVKAHNVAQEKFYLVPLLGPRFPHKH